MLFRFVFHICSRFVQSLFRNISKKPSSLSVDGCFAVNDAEHTFTAFKRYSDLSVLVGRQHGSDPVLPYGQRLARGQMHNEVGDGIFALKREQILLI